jgi:hypothetical protein
MSGAQIDREKTVKDMNDFISSRGTKVTIEDLDKVLHISG